MSRSQAIDASKVHYVLFDLFGTLVRFRDVVPREERKAYGDHLKASQIEWSPFRPPESWSELPAFPDSFGGLIRIRRNRRIVILSNCPTRLAHRIALRQNLLPDYVIQLAAARVFKPQPKAYQVALDVLDTPSENCLMVTANEKFGDLEQARAIGMQACLIRSDSDIPDIIALAERLGC